MTMRDPRMQKLARLILLVISTLQLGGYIVVFRGDLRTWIALAATLVVFVIVLFGMTRDIWKSAPPGTSQSPGTSD